MAINLHEKYASEIQSKFSRESLIAGRLSDCYSFTGVKTVNITTPITVPMVDYTRTGSNRYGEPLEMQDIVQEMTLTQDKSFAMTIDKGNNSDQSGVKQAGKMLSLQIAEQAVPTMDKYCFNRLIDKAGKIVGSEEALTKENICERITAATVHMDDAEVPAEDRTLFVSSESYAMLRGSEEFMKCDALLHKSLAKGQVGSYDGMTVVKVPSSRWPEGVNFIVVHKASACAPVKLNDTKLHQDPPGISGALLEGRQYYDLFVFGAKCEGVYVDVNTAIKPKLTGIDYDLNLGKIEFVHQDGGITYYYTLDGTDPRYSKTRAVGGTVDYKPGEMHVLVYGTKPGFFNSDIIEINE